jgi:predicted CXXCH cytochrome family protein
VKRAIWVAVAVFALGGLAAGVSWVLRMREETKPKVPEAYVASTWDVVRDTVGHQVHVGKEHKRCTECHEAEDGGLDHPGPEKCAKCHEERAQIRHALGGYAAAHGDMAGAASDAAVMAKARDAATLVAPRDAAVADGALADAGDAGFVHGPLSTCLDCHGFGMNAAPAPTDCIRCHQNAQGDLHPVVTHASAACTECHQVHENKIAAAACTSCHTKISVKHGHAGADIASQCRVCHDAHSEAKLAVEGCLSCHGPKSKLPVPHTAVFSEGHTCASCHRAHEFEKKSVVACRTCHESVHPLAGHERQGCTSCHQPHAVRAQIEGGAICTTCHKDIKLEHAGKKARELGACTGCHTPHPPKPQSAPQACTSCHQDIGGPTHTAHAATTTCTTCHAPHGFHLELNMGLCKSCHASQVAALQKRSEHKDCASCHQGLPHTLGSPVQPCGACHKEIQGKVNKGHSECRNCHEPHQAGVQLASCEQCHARETKQHPRGHDQCRQCHEQHTGTPKPGVADCSACHKAKKLSGLHREPKHTADGCQQCHAPHGSSAPGERQLCLTCHKDRVDHQPEATRCDGCHTFIGVRPRSTP